MSTQPLNRSALPVEARSLLDRIEAVVRPAKRMAVALSGGVDSSVLVAALALILGSENVLAVTVDAPMTTMEDERDAKASSEISGVRRMVIHLDESILEEPCFRSNPDDRCYSCKKLIFSRILETAAAEGFLQLADGTNADDLGEVRPGLKALREFGVVSPFANAGMTKPEIRVLAASICPHVSDKPAMACLATRIPHGTPVTMAAMKGIESAERALRDAGFAQVRVRVHADLARLEIDRTMLEKGLTGEMIAQLGAILHAAGFNFATLDLDGYRTGGVSHTIPTGGNKP